MASAKPITLTDGSFEEEINGSPVPILVDFWAEWCGPCKTISPILEELAQEKSDSLRIGKLNVDENLETARRFEVMSIPTLILFKDGEPTRRIVGSRPKAALLKELDAYL